jgi:hypothetical protein
MKEEKEWDESQIGTAFYCKPYKLIVVKRLNNDNLWIDLTGCPENDASGIWKMKLHQGYLKMMEKVEPHVQNMIYYLEE